MINSNKSASVAKCILVPASLKLSNLLLAPFKELSCDNSESAYNTKSKKLPISFLCTTSPVALEYASNTYLPLCTPIFSSGFIIFWFIFAVHSSALCTKFLYLVTMLLSEFGFVFVLSIIEVLLLLLFISIISSYSFPSKSFKIWILIGFPFSIYLKEL